MRPALAAALAALLAAAAAAQDLPGLGAGDAPEPPQRTIAQSHSPADDRALARRLREIYAQVEGLAGVEVEVGAGVVRLSGEVLSSGAREKAVKIAEALQGVVEVQQEIDESVDLDRRLRPVFADLRERGLDALVALPLFGVALAALAAFWLLGRALTLWEAPYRRISRNDFARDLLRQAVRGGAVLVGAVVALEILDATAIVAAVAGFAGLAGLALSFAFRDLAENYIASVLLSLRQPFLANEHVVIDGNEGHVVRLTSRATILINPDGNHVRLPNAAVFKATILNYSRNPRRRFDFDVGVAPDTDLGAALHLGIETLGRMPRVLDDPAPLGQVESLGDWSVALRFFGWIDQREADWGRARGEAMRVVKEAFDAAGVVMPEPTLRTLALETPERAPAPAASVPEELAIDLAPDSQVADAIAADRAAAGDEDLLGDTRETE